MSRNTHVSLPLVPIKDSVPFNRLECVWILLKTLAVILVWDFCLLSLPPTPNFTRLEHIRTKRKCYGSKSKYYSIKWRPHVIKRSKIPFASVHILRFSCCLQLKPGHMKQNKPVGNNQRSKSTRHKKAITSSLRVSRASGVQNGLWKKTRVAQTCWNSEMITVIKAKTRNKKQEPETKKRQKKDPLSPPHHTTPKCQAVPVTYLC